MQTARLRRTPGPVAASRLLHAGRRPAGHRSNENHDRPRRGPRRGRARGGARFSLVWRSSQRPPPTPGPGIAGRPGAGRVSSTPCPPRRQVDDAPGGEWARATARPSPGAGATAGAGAPVRATRGRSVLARFDLAYPPQRIAVEFDSYRHHFGRQAWSRDHVRTNRVTALDWLVFPLTEIDLRDPARASAAEVKRAYRLRRAR